MQRNLKLLLIMIILILLSAFTASLVQSNFGSLRIEYVKIDNNGQTITGKIYIPDSATTSSPVSAVLVLHGLNNDKETEGPTSLELAKRGFVVLALDESGHGDSDRGDNLITAENSSLGANAAYEYLQTLSYVKTHSIGLVGHSMGGSSANVVAKTHPDHKAIVYQAFTPLNLSENNYLHNYLQLWPKYEESSSLDRATFTSEGVNMIKYNLQLNGLTPRGDVYDQTYGNFSAGTAQRYVRIDSTHPGGTWDSLGIREVVAWMLQALDGKNQTESTESAKGQTYMFKELLTLTALVLLIFSSIPLTELLMEQSYFKEIKTTPSDKVFTEGKDWWKLATINSLIGGFTYYLIPLFALLGIAISMILPIFGLLLGSMYTIWFLVNALIAWIFVKRFIKNNGTKTVVDDKEVVQPLSMKELGAFDKEKTVEEKSIWRKTLLLATVVFVYFFAMTAIAQFGFKVEYRFMWSFFRVLTPFRFFEFLLYLIPIYQFFRINGGTLLFGIARLKDESLLIWWLKVLYGWVGAIALLFAIFYFPTFLFGTSHFVELGGLLWLFCIFLMSIIPEFAVVYLLLIIFYKNTGRIYLGAFIATMIVTWALSTGVI